ncbi:MAG: tyrosine-protein phosphatase [Actinomycetota bacterium]|nr:tyrosine-protein phosphatase [Actinomycetota bacterium]
MNYIYDEALRISLEGSFNLREVSGYFGNLGRVAPGMIFRSDHLGRLTDDDIEVVKDLKIRSYIDLRTEKETLTQGEYPEKLLENATRHHISMIDISANYELARGESGKDYIFNRYVEMLTFGKENIAKVFKTIASSNEGALLFHCAVGKDRTGIVAALLLDILGVHRVQIVEDYAATQKAMDQFQLWLEDVAPEELDKIRDVAPIILGAKRIDMEKTLNHVDQNHGGSVNYLLEIGVTEQEIEVIRERYLL